MLTPNAKKVLRFILTSFNRDYSINNIAKACNLSPNGAYKILKKFEEENILISRDIANIKSYKLNYDNDKTRSILELILMPVLDNKLKFRKEDLIALKDITKACILFGSYITSKKEANDLDILFVIEKSNFKKYKRNLSEIQLITPLKIHDVIQTEQDLLDNIRKQDDVVIGALKNGLILWGQKTIIDIIKNV